MKQIIITSRGTEDDKLEILKIISMNYEIMKFVSILTKKRKLLIRNIIKNHKKPTTNE